MTQLPDLLVMTGSRDDQLQALLNVDGVQKATAEKVLLGVQQFKQFLQNHPGIVVVEDHRAVPASAMGLPRFSEMAVVFAGVRDPELAAKICEVGGRVTKAMYPNTTVLVVQNARIVISEKDAQLISSRIQKAEKMGIRVMQVQAYQDFCVTVMLTSQILV